MRWLLAVGAAGLGVAAYLAWRERNSPASPFVPPARRFVKPGTRLLVIGDSYAVGLSQWLAALGKQAGVPVRAIGCPVGSKGGAACSAVVGSGVSHWAQDSWLGPNIAAINPTLVLISLGGNDFQRTDPANVQASISSLVGKLKAAGAEVVWISPLPLPFADKIGVRDMWKRSGVDGWFDGEKLEYPRAGDKIHLYPEGYRDWASVVWKWLGGS